MTRVTHLYGLALTSDIPLHQDRPVGQTKADSIEIRVGSTIAASTDRPQGHILLDLDIDGQYFTAVRSDEGFLLRFYDTCDVVIDSTLGRALIHPYPDGDPTILSVLVGGPLLAFMLSMRGEAVLHASAVQVGSSAIAFVGSSGMGKSTMAALLSADGARLITDDILRLDLAHRPPTCSLGATELRLRKAAGDLADRFAERPRRRVTADERDALAIPVATTPDLPLAAIIVPQPDRDLDPTRATVERIDPMAAFLLLTRFPRLLGWQDAEVLQRQFQQLGHGFARIQRHDR
ncbi:MAG: hypothetical protein KDB18_11195, partial [Salinibacterium sp.]|nr:hypothetical protein [Salinibacterium sp.]